MACHQGDAAAGDDAFDLALDTEELLQNPVLGPLAAGTLERFAPGLDPREALFPVTRGPFGLPSPVPIPRLERLYFKCAPATSLCVLSMLCPSEASASRRPDVRPQIQSASLILILEDCSSRQALPRAVPSELCCFVQKGLM